MADTDLERMMQTTLDLVGILRAHREQAAEDVMGGMMRFINQLEKSCSDIREELGKDRSPEALFQAMMRPNALASRFGAQDLMEVNRRASSTFADLLGDDDAKMSPEAMADVMVWLRVCEQTMIAVKLLFQVSHLYGRAPNGARLTPPKSSG